MKKQSFVPRTDSAIRLWLNNFSKKLPLYAGKYGISQNEVNEVLADATSIDNWLQYQNAVNKYNHSVNAFKDELLYGIPAGATPSGAPAALNQQPPAAAIPDVLGRATSIGNRIKKHKDYTISDGNDLQLEGAETTLDPQHARPSFSIRLIAGGHPELVWKKAGMDAIEIYKMDMATGNWKLLAVDTYPNYTDNSPLPEAGKGELWQYRCIYRYRDEQVGEWSDTVSVMVSGQ